MTRISSDMGIVYNIIIIYNIIFIANKTLAGKAIQYNTTLQTYIHEQHKEMSYIHS